MTYGDDLLDPIGLTWAGPDSGMYTPSDATTCTLESGEPDTLTVDPITGSWWFLLPSDASFRHVVWTLASDDGAAGQWQMRLFYASGPVAGFGDLTEVGGGFDANSMASSVEWDLGSLDPGLDWYMQVGMVGGRTYGTTLSLTAVDPDYVPPSTLWFEDAFATSLGGEIDLTGNAHSLTSASIAGFTTEPGEQRMPDSSDLPLHSGWLQIVPDEDGSLTVSVQPVGSDAAVQVVIYQPGEDAPVVDSLLPLAWAEQTESNGGVVLHGVEVQQGEPVWLWVNYPFDGGPDLQVDITPDVDPGLSRADALTIDGTEGSETFTTGGDDDTTWLVWSGAVEGTTMLFRTSTAAPADVALHVEDDNATTIVDASDAGGAAVVRFVTEDEFDDVNMTYYLQVTTAGGPQEITLSWADVTDLEGDEPETAVEIDGDYGSEDVETENMTVADGETVTSGVTATSWLLWQAPADLAMTFTAEGDEDVLTTLTVFTGAEGSALADLTEVVAETGDVGGGEVSFDAALDDWYWIRVGVAVDSSGPVEVTWSAADEEVDVPSDDAPYLRCEVYDRTGDVMLSEVPRRWRVSGNEPLNTTGTGELTVRVDDPVLAAYPKLLASGNIVKFWLLDTCISGFRIQRVKTTLVGSDESAAWVRSVSGPTVQGMLDDFMVKHDRQPPRPDSQSTRNFDWTSMRDDWYHASDWDEPIAAKPYSDPPGKGAKKKQPARWPDKRAEWMYVRPAHQTLRQPVHGLKYYRRRINVRKGGLHVRMYASADEWFRVYLDGEEVMSAQNVETGYTMFETYDVVLTKGIHDIAAVARNFKSAKGDANDSFLFTMMRVNTKGKPTSVVVHSNERWEAFYGKNVPGWNRAQVLTTVVQEAQARGNTSANRLSLDFTTTHDTAGRRWVKNRWDQEVSIGTSALDLQSKLSEGNGFDVWVDPEDMTIKAWVRRGRNRAGSVTLETGRNLLSYEVEAVDEVKNTFTVQIDGDWTTWRSKSSVRANGAREAYVELGKVKETSVARKIMAGVVKGLSWALHRAGNPDIRTAPVGTPDGGLIAVHGAVPFRDFGVGDVVKAPNADMVLVKQRVLGIAFTEDENGNLTFDPELEVVGRG